MTTRWSFRPPWWAWLGLAAGCAVTIHLGFWQLRRGHAREAMLADYLAAQAAEPQALDGQAAPPPEGEARSAKASGSWLDRSLLLDNQVHDQRAGYEVLTPLRLVSGGIVLVDRGWLPRSADGKSLPTVAIAEQPAAPRGLWRALPQPALRLATANCDAAATTWPRITEYPTAEDLACLYGEPVANGLLLLAADQPDGFLREWTTVDSRFPPTRNYGYAAQWFAFAATLLVLFIKLNLKRRP